MMLDRTFVRFGAVGVFNTVNNLLILNLFIFSFGLSPATSNILAVSISMFISFLLNKNFVFRLNDKNRPFRTFGLFIACTLFSQLVVHQAVFLLSMATLGGVVGAVYSNTSLLVSFSEQFYLVNLSKGLAIIVSVAVTYLLYKKLVFVGYEKATQES